MGGIEEKDPLLVNNLSPVSASSSRWPVFGFLFPVTCLLSPNFGYLDLKRYPKTYLKPTFVAAITTNPETSIKNVSQNLLKVAFGWL